MKSIACYLTHIRCTMMNTMNSAYSVDSSCKEQPFEYTEVICKVFCMPITSCEKYDKVLKNV